MPHRYFDVDRPVVIGHRGAAGTHPENTLESFAAALEQGAQILESDVHVSCDGVPLLLHDPDVGRVTEGEGLASALDFAEDRPDLVFALARQMAHAGRAEEARLGAETGLELAGDVPEARRLAAEVHALLGDEGR